MEVISIPLAKRLVDIFLSLLMLFLSLPFSIIFLIIIFAEHICIGCPIAPLFYKEIRYSQGRPFWLVKFNIFNPRVINQYKKESKFIHTKELEQVSGNLLRIGYIMKQIYIDELPQLVNVLAGDLSLVGPRPVNVEVYKKLVSQGIMAKAVIRAGITGSYQSRKDTTDKSDKELDQEYIDFCRSHSALQIVMNDLKIMIRTLFLMLRAKGL